MRATFFAFAFPLLLAGCASQIPLPEVTARKSPITASAKVPKTHHHTILTGYTHREAVSPEAWVTEDAPAVPEADKPKEECKTKEGASNDCPVH